MRWMPQKLPCSTSSPHKQISRWHEIVATASQSHMRPFQGQAVHFSCRGIVTIAASMLPTALHTGNPSA